VRACAAGSKAAFDNHVEPQLRNWRFRNFYTPRANTGEMDLATVRHHEVGLSKAEYSLPMRVQLKEYITECRALHASGVDIPAATPYWLSKAETWPALFRAASYWLSFMTSSVPAERAFALLRAVGHPQRMSANLGT
jgi:hypothetical protein